MPMLPSEETLLITARILWVLRRNVTTHISKSARKPEQPGASLECD